MGMGVGAGAVEFDESTLFTEFLVSVISFSSNTAIGQRAPLMGTTWTG